MKGASCGRRPWFEQQALGVWTEFFNTRIDRVAHVYGQNKAAGIPSPGSSSRRRRRAPDRRRGRTLTAPYVVLDSRQPIAGTRLRRFDLDPAVTPYGDGASLSLWRAEAPLRLAPGRRRCRSGGRRCCG